MCSEWGPNELHAELLSSATLGGRKLNILYRLVCELGGPGVKDGSGGRTSYGNMLNSVDGMPGRPKHRSGTAVVEHRPGLIIARHLLALLRGRTFG